MKDSHWFPQVLQQRNNVGLSLSNPLSSSTGFSVRPEQYHRTESRVLQNMVENMQLSRMEHISSEGSHSPIDSLILKGVLSKDSDRYKTELCNSFEVCIEDFELLNFQIIFSSYK